MSIYNIGGSAINECFNLDTDSIDMAYSMDGEIVFQKEYNPTLQLLNTSLMSSINPSTAISPQGFAMYNGHWFQFFTGDNKMRVFRLSDYSLVGEYVANNIGHANVMQFGTVEQDTGFPLLYVSEWGDSISVDSKKIDILKVSLAGYEVIDSYTMPNSVGYHPNQIIDWESNIAYIIGYANSLQTDASQPNIVTAMRMGDKIVIDQFQVPYLGVANGIEFHNGNIYFYGDTWNAAQMRLSLIDVATHNVAEYRLDKTTNEEFEDCAIYDGWLYISNWIYDATDGNKLKYRIFKMNL